MILVLVIFRPHKWGRKIMICDAFFLQILPKLHLISTVWSDLLAIVTTELLPLWWLSQVVGPGFEPGLALDFFVSQPVGRGFEPLLRHTFFAIGVSRKISWFLAGVLCFIHIVLEYNKTPADQPDIFCANCSSKDFF